MIYWGIANPDPYTRLSRHGRHDAVPFESPVNLFADSTVAIDIETGKLKWYYQELPGDDWDADHNQERILARVKLNPDPSKVKWISQSLPRGEERDVVISVAEGGGMFVVERDSGKFLWAHPFPYDVPDFNISGIDLKTGATRINVDKLFKTDGQTILGCYHNVRGLWSIAYNPKNSSLYVPFQDQCLQMQANMKAKTGWGPRKGLMRPGIDPNKYMNLAKIDMTTGEMKVLHSQPQASAGSTLVTAGDLLFWGDQNRRFRAFDAETGKVLWQGVVGGMVMNSIGRYMDAGITVGIGTDTFPHNMLDEMRLVCYLARAITMNYKMGTTRHAFEAATIGGAKMLRRPDLGRLAPGCKADFSLVDMSHPYMQPAHEPVRSLIYSAGDRVALNRKKHFAGHVTAGYACQNSFSPDGRHLASGDGEGALWFWEWRTGRFEKKLRVHSGGPCIGAVWHPLRPSTMATCGWDGVIALLE